MNKAYLIFDIGTGNSRAAVVSEAGEILAVAKEDSIVYLDHTVKGASWFDPRAWEETLLRLAKGALEKAGAVQVSAVCASSLRQGIVLIDHQGEPVVGYPNSDRRGEAFMGELDWKRIWDLTDLSPSPIFSALKIVGAMHREPEVVERTAFYTSISDWVGYVFTGKAVWERAQAMQSGLYDPQSGQWSEELCRLFGVSSSKLPPLADAGTVLGPVEPELCRELGLAEDALFIVGTADTQAAVTGAGAETGEVVIASGTTTPSVKIIPEFRKYPLTWVSPTAERDRFMLEVNTTSSGINLQRYKNTMLSHVSYDHLNADALEKGLPEQNLPACYAVFLRGMHLDEDFLAGGFLMSNPFSTDIKVESFFHAMCLNIGMGIAMCVKRIDSLDKLERDYLVGCGGGFLSPVIGQTVADLMGLPVRLYKTFRESTVFGCYALCRRATGIEPPERVVLKTIEPRKSQALEDYFETWKACREQLKQIKL